MRRIYGALGSEDDDDSLLELELELETSDDSTLGFERRADRWLITHDHGSVPFAPETGKASLSLEP